MAGPDGEMCESGGTLSGGEMHTKFCLEIAEKKGGSRGNELDKPGRRGHVLFAEKGEIETKLISLS